MGGQYEVPHSAPAYISSRPGYQGAVPLGGYLTGNGDETVVYEKSRELGLSDAQAGFADFIFACPELIIAVPRGFIKGGATALAEVGPKSGRAVVFNIGELEGKAIEGAAKKATKAITESPAAAAAAAGKITQGVESGAKAVAPKGWINECYTPHSGRSRNWTTP
jgi:hypothetical protein